MSDPTKFNFVGSIPGVMLERVPEDNAIVTEYHRQPLSGVRPITEEFRKILKEVNKPNRGGKKKVNATPSEVVKTLKKVKKPT